MICIYNTLTKTKDEFKPITPGKVTMYVCGPTVYNFIHIGNARPMIVFDTVRRYFSYKGYEVNYVSNFTDVDDKIIKGAIEENTTSEEISQRYIAECKKDMEAMNILPATKNPQATQEIQGMINMIQTLIDKGYAYPVSDGTVYYRTRKFQGYGKLSHKNIDDLEGGHRDIKVTGDLKEDPLDFVLWKPKKEGEPSWPSPWCDGRPGWEKVENIYNVKNEDKYSYKTIGLTEDVIREISEKYDLQVLRFFMLTTHYRKALNFSAELMESAKTSLQRITTAAELLRERMASVTSDEMTAEEEAKIATLNQFRSNFEEAMDDDFNTADAITAIFDIVKFINTETDADSSKAFLQAIHDEFYQLADVLGIILEKKEEVLDSEIEDLIHKRQEARKNKDFARADEIRDQLLSMGIQLKDTREGVKWQRV